MITWVLYLCIGIVIGGMAGFYFAKLDDFSKKQKQELEDKLHKTEQELVEYKDQVTAHFIETANLINNMTESYQKVHEHLAKGSVDLCNNAVEVNKLKVSSNELLSAKTGIGPDSADEVTNLAESEAPKTDKVENNNNKPEVEAAEVAGLAEKESTETTAADTEASVSTKDTSAENEFSPDNIPSSHQSETKSSANAATSGEDTVELPVLETMAVAEEEDSTDKSRQDDEDKNQAPGSRMVH